MAVIVVPCIQWTFVVRDLAIMRIDTLWRLRCARLVSNDEWRRRVVAVSGYEFDRVIDDE